MFILSEALLREFLNVTVQAAYANGNVENYGDGEPGVEIIFHRNFGSGNICTNNKKTRGCVYIFSESFSVFQTVLKLKVFLTRKIFGGN